jgi:hypothetical protein
MRAIKISCLGRHGRSDRPLCPLHFLQAFVNAKNSARPISWDSDPRNSNHLRGKEVRKSGETPVWKLSRADITQCGHSALI